MGRVIAIALLLLIAFLTVATAGPGARLLILLPSSGGSGNGPFDPTYFDSAYFDTGS